MLQSYFVSLTQVNGALDFQLQHAPCVKQKRQAEQPIETCNEC